ncbi:MAG: hypothetical protein JWP45_1409 [Mucilaginibacter sp.]|nr:hypothetical protein [Mucilaginibacter sp.]
MIKEKPVDDWPKLIYDNLKDTLQTVQLWTQIVGKIRMVNTPWINHGWHVTLYVSSRGLSTGRIPYGNNSFQIDFDFIEHQLVVSASDGGLKRLRLQPKTVASFYSDLFSLLNKMNIATEIYAKPNELELAIPFAADNVHKTYDAHQMHTYWQALVRIDSVFTRFRAEFIGKCSPVHLFWGGFDLAVTRFSGRTAPLYQGKVPNMPGRIMQEAYSHEVSSAGFWPGSDVYPFPAFYSYCYPSQPGYNTQPVAPEQAFYNIELGEFILNYEAVQQAQDPEGTLLKFLRSTYEAAAKTGNWDRKLDCNLTSFEK